MPDTAYADFMSTTLKLSWYDGPAAIAGVAIPVVHLREQADSRDGQILKTWNGRAVVARNQAPDLTFEWGENIGRADIELPGIGTGECGITSMTLIDGQVWELEIAGIGPSPLK